MAVQFDGDNLLITLPAGVYQIDVIGDIYGDWKDWMLSNPKNRGYPPAFGILGGDPLSAIINAGSYLFLENQNGWRIKPAEEDGTWWFNGNLAPRDSTLDVFVKTTGVFNTQILGLQPVTQGVTPAMAQQLEYGSYQNNSVWVDAIGGLTLAQYVTLGVKNPGSRQYPLNTTSEAVDEANTRGFGALSFLGNLTLGLGDNIAEFTIEGVNPVTQLLTVLTDAITDNCYIKNCSFTGVLDGGSILQDCVLGEVQYFNGFVEHCALTNNTIFINGQAVFSDCFTSATCLTGPPIIDLTNTAGLALRDFKGSVDVVNKTSTATCEVGLSGTFTIHPSIVSGRFKVYGTGVVIDNGTGTSVLEDYTTGTVEEVANGIWNAATIDHTITGSFGSQMNRMKHLQYSVFIDTRSLIAGDGSQQSPFNNFSTAADYAEQHNITSLVALADITLDRSLKEFTITGVGAVNVDVNGQDLRGTTFFHCTLTGTYVNHIVAQGCNLNNLDLNGYFENCVFSGTFPVHAGALPLVKNCAAYVEGGFTKPVFDIGGVAGTAGLVVMGYEGGMTVANVNQATDDVKVNVEHGIIELDSTCTNGTIVMLGDVTLVDNSNGTTITDLTIKPSEVKETHTTVLSLGAGGGSPTASEIAEEVWNHPI